TYTALNATAGNSSASSTATVTVTVTAVNDAPSFAKGADQEANDESGPQSVDGWATQISSGPANDSSQTLQFKVTLDNPSLLAVQPAIDAHGRLTFTPAPNADGTTTLTVYLHDSGGTAGGGVDSSPTQTFTIHIAKLHPLHNEVNSLDATGDG